MRADPAADRGQPALVMVASPSDSNRPEPIGYLALETTDTPVPTPPEQIGVSVQEIARVSLDFAALVLLYRQYAATAQRLERPRLRPVEPIPPRPPKRTEQLQPSLF